MLYKSKQLGFNRFVFSTNQIEKCFHYQYAHLCLVNCNNAPKPYF